LLKANVTAFPNGTDQLLGTGIVNADAAVRAAIEHGGGGGIVGVQTYTNDADFRISDHSYAWSPITVAGRNGNGSAVSVIDVKIVHTRVGDLWVDLYSPSGFVRRLRSPSGGSTGSINARYQVDLSSEPLNGTWWLRVYDGYSRNTGRIDSWSITF
jgi:subtilisin-like proprotein convertase family protein